MFRTTTWFWRLLLGLLLLAGIAGAGFTAYRVGYSQGYIQGAAAVSDGETLVPARPFRPGGIRPNFYPGYFGLAPFRMIGSLFCGGLVFLALLGLIFRPRPWRHIHDWTQRGPWSAAPGTPPAQPGAQTGAEPPQAA